MVIFTQKAHLKKENTKNPNQDVLSKMNDDEDMVELGRANSRLARL